MDHPYESLSYVARLEFKDAYGLEALFHCYQRIRVRSPELLYIAHRIWGDGDQLAEIASPTTPVAATVKGGRYTVVISRLISPAGYGQEIEVHSVRRIHHAFKDQHESWEYVPLTPTERARITIAYPIAKEPYGIGVSQSVLAKAPHVTRPGTKEIVVAIDRPTLHATYRVDWTW